MTHSGYIAGIECVLLDIAGERSKNLQVTSCSGFFATAKTELANQLYNTTYMYIDQLCRDTGCLPEYLTTLMQDHDGWCDKLHVRATTSCKNSGYTSPSWGAINFPIISLTAAPLPPLSVLLARQKNVGNLNSQH